MFFCWITTRRGLFSAGYGWLLRGVFGGLGLVIILVGVLGDFEPVREAGAAVLIVGTVGGVLISVFKWGKNPAKSSAWLDFAAAMGGLVGVIAGGVIADGSIWLSVFRVLVGALFMGVLTDSMLLGHWYLVQPGMPRHPLKELIFWAMGLCALEAFAFLLPTGMVSVFTGAVEDGHDGLLGWFWLASIVTTAILVVASMATLKEKGYQAVMAMTGLTYLSLLTGFVADVVARLALRPM